MTSTILCAPYPPCAGTTLYAIQLAGGAAPERVLDPFPSSKVGRQVHLGPSSDTLQLERPGDPLAPPAVVDVIVEVQFDPNTVFTHRLLGYEDALNPEPLGSIAEGRARTGSMRAGEQITAVYDLHLKPEKSPELEVRVDYRIPRDPKVRHIIHRLTPDNTHETPWAAPRDLRHVVAVAGFGAYLQRNFYLDPSPLDEVLRLASRSNEREREFVRWVQDQRRVELNAL